MCCRRDYLSDYTGDYYGFEGRHVLGAVEAMQLHKVNAIFERLASLCLLCNKTSTEDTESRLHSVNSIATSPLSGDGKTINFTCLLSQRSCMFVCFHCLRCADSSSGVSLT